jgi:Flp pilus assembly protein TadD
VAACGSLARAETAAAGLAEVPLLRGLMRCAAQDFEAAAGEFSEAARRAPRSRRVLGHLAHVLSRLGRVEQAAGAFTRLLELDPQNPEVLLDTGDCMVALGRMDMAHECFRLAGLLAPEDPAVRERLRLLGAPRAFEEELPLAG